MPLISTFLNIGIQCPLSHVFLGQRNEGSDAVTVRMNEGKKNVLVAKGSTGSSVK